MNLFKSKIALLVIFFPFKGSSQDITGVWTGDYKNVKMFMSQPKKVVLELYRYNDSLITGVSHLYYTYSRYEHHKLSGVYRKTDSTATLTEDSILSYRYAGGKVCGGIYTMKLTVHKNKLRFNGRWKDKSRGFLHCPSVNVWLDKDFQPETIQTFLQSKQTDTVRSQSQNRASMRASDIQQVIEIRKSERDSIKIEIVDNGIVDGDTVSIYLDDQQVVKRHGISETPATFYFNLNESLQKIKMVAENTGSIPPNTALLIITTTRKKYEIYLSSDMQKNAVVEFFLK